MYWQHHLPSTLTEGQTFLVVGGLADGSKVKFIDSTRCVDVESMFCRHEEADTRMIFHASAAARSGFERVVVNSPDTDVLVLLVHFACLIGCEVWLRLPKGGRLYAAHYIARSLGATLCQVLPAFHAITGCDTTSCLVRQGKVKPWEMLKTNITLYSVVGDLGKKKPEKRY